MQQLFRSRGLIVSCQALPGEALYGSAMMAGMALAAERAGAIGIRTNGVEDVQAIKQTVRLPVIGLIKRNIPGSDVFITPELSDAAALIQAGADIVALDVTDRENRIAEAENIIRSIHDEGLKVMADVSTFAEGKRAEEIGADFVSTTLSGYTAYSPQCEEPDFSLVRKLAGCLRVPVVAEGRIWKPQQAVEAMRSGASYVVVGSAITRPQMIAERYVDQLAKWLDYECSVKKTGIDRQNLLDNGEAISG